jgi:hypothetical protein
MIKMINNNLKMKRFIGLNADIAFNLVLRKDMPVIESIRKLGSGIDREIILWYF